uniref:TIDP2936 n=1 Tax=Arundo donax TaxID=35708 RepID=A0A0A8YP79_ARUDO
MSPSFAFASSGKGPAWTSPSPIMTRKMDGPGTGDMVTDMPRGNK